LWKGRERAPKKKLGTPSAKGELQSTGKCFNISSRKGNIFCLRRWEKRSRKHKKRKTLYRMKLRVLKSRSYGGKGEKNHRLHAQGGKKVWERKQRGADYRQKLRSRWSGTREVLRVASFVERKREREICAITLRPRRTE